MENLLSTDEELVNLSLKAEALKARWPIYNNMIDWLVDLLTETIKAGERSCVNRVSFDRTQIEKEFSKGKPLFAPGNIPVDIELTKETYYALVKKTERYLGREMGGLKDLFIDSATKFSKLVKEALKCDSHILKLACKEHDVDYQAVNLLLRLALRPSIKKISKKAADEIDLNQWSYGYCPVCGSAPAFVKLGEEGESRFLYCSLCEISWAFPRLRCPFCGNENQDDLCYLYPEGDEGVRVDLCHRCQGRIKTIDINYPSGTVIPFLDELVTSHLSMAID